MYDSSRLHDLMHYERGTGVPVTDQQLAALRAYLVGDWDLYRELFGQLARREAGKEYSALITAAFAEAAERYFRRNYTQGDIVAFVGHARARSERAAGALEPEVAERVINAVLGDTTTRDLDRKAVVGTQVVLLAALIAEENLDSTALGRALADARNLADQILGG